ncbi:hypothetical protein BDM02DRAFT_3130485 [Thelephora ganbajun]|uniref:Uncharacterized protein n=1 Tax=Thelephora ganbajun TaxID=370292 RepID=A0ACB6ZA75_THEGA|nr:hypothetical protein BDM02DRAFT_3130485 [Thelephora ganbajun]
MYASDSLDTILSHLSTRVMNVVVDGSGLHPLNYLLEFPVPRKKRPACPTPTVYQWCLVVSETAGRLLSKKKNSPTLDLVVVPSAWMTLTLRIPTTPDPRLPATSLPIILGVGLRLAVPSYDWPALQLDHTSHHKWVFKTTFSSRDDEVIVDALSAWVIDGGHAPPGSCARRLARRMERDKRFPPRLRRVGLGNVSSHNWCLLDKVVLAADFGRDFKSRDVEMTPSQQTTRVGRCRGHYTGDSKATPTTTISPPKAGMTAPRVPTRSRAFLFVLPNAYPH